MTIVLLSAIPRHERRLRVLFSNTLAAGGFLASTYVVTSQDSAGVDPPILAALAVPGISTAAELVLGEELVKGGVYLLSCLAVPATDASTYTGSDPFRFGDDYVRADREPETNDLPELLYGRDLVWDGTDYVEGPDGDLATVTGAENAISAIRRRCMGNPLPWNPGYSPRAYDYVDAPSPMMPTLRGQLVAQVRADDRVSDVEVTMTVDDKTSAVTFSVRLTLIGETVAQSFDVAG